MPKISKEEKERRKEQRRIDNWNETHKVIDGVDYKLCKICNEYKPSNETFFYKNSSNGIDGLHPYCKECTIKSSREYAVENKELTVQRQKEWRDNNLEYFRVSVSKWYYDNKEYKQEYTEQYMKENKSKIKIYQDKRKSKKHIISKREWKLCKEYFDDSCAYCGLHLSEHFVPRKGSFKHMDLHKEHVDANGSVYLDNCVPSCYECNIKKWEHSFDSWYNENNPKFTQGRYEKIIKWLSEDYLKYFEGYREKRKHNKKQE